MSDYTPTTEWVIAGWMKARASDGITADIAFEEINRWLAEVKAQAWQEGYSTGLAEDSDTVTFNPYGYAQYPYRQGETE